MEDFLPENLGSTIKEKVNDELIEGRELAKQLRDVIAESSRTAEDLLTKIVESFSNTLSILNVKEGQLIQPHLPCLDARKSKDQYSQESVRKSTTPLPPTRKLDRRGCNETRRTSSTLRTWKIDTPALINDGQAWRKYGQKVILNAKYPRHYFRCTYKDDQGCKATKQVQRIEVNPPLYRTTYFGNHTCRNLNLLVEDPELTLDSTSPSDSSIFMISFDGTNNLTNKRDHFPFSSSFSSSKHEFKEDIITCDANHNVQSLSPSDHYYVSPDDLAAFQSTLDQSDHGDQCINVWDDGVLCDDFYLD